MKTDREWEYGIERHAQLVCRVDEIQDARILQKFRISGFNWQRK